MQSRLFVNILLLILVVILVITVYSSNKLEPVELETLTTIDPGSITNITIIHKGRIMVLEKTDQHWSITQPISIAANDFRVNSVIKIVQTPSRASYDINGLTLENYGLDKPVTTITLNNTSIDFGTVNPVNNYRYVKLGNKIYLTDDYFYPLLSSQIGTLVSLNPLTDDSDIVKLVLPDQSLEINNQGLWQSNKNISSDAIIETISNWKHDQAFGVHNYLKRDSLGSIEIYLKNSDKPVLFEITDTDPWLIIARPELDLEYHYNLEFYDRLLRPGASKQLPPELAE